MFLKNKKETAFTLVEVLVTVFIIGILSAVVVANFGEGRNEYSLDTVARKLVADIRRAQSMAINTVEANGAFYCGYGIHFDLNAGGVGTGDNTSYTIFGDNCSGANNDKKYSSGEKIREASLSEGIYFSEIEYRNTSGELNLVDTFFLPPDPDVWVFAYVSSWGGVAEISSDGFAYIELSNSKGDTQEIKIYSDGRVDY